MFGFPFSATCYYFGRDLHLSLGKEIPVGLIASSWGGCPIEPWMRAQALAKCAGGGDGGDIGGANGGMFNAMMAPFANLRVSGMLWDQGEANVGNPRRCALPSGLQNLGRTHFLEPRVQMSELKNTCPSCAQKTNCPVKLGRILQGNPTPRSDSGRFLLLRRVRKAVFRGSVPFGLMGSISCKPHQTETGFLSV